MSHEKCKYEDKLLKPCADLQSLLDDKKGIDLQVWSRRTNKGMERTRSFLVLKSGEYRKGGMAANFCPMCGADIFPHKGDL